MNSDVNVRDIVSINARYEDFSFMIVHEQATNHGEHTAKLKRIVNIVVNIIVIIIDSYWHHTRKPQKVMEMTT